MCRHLFILGYRALHSTCLEPRLLLLLMLLLRRLVMGDWSLSTKCGFLKCYVLWSLRTGSYKVKQQRLWGDLSQSHKLTLPMLRPHSPKHKDAKIFENHLNPVILVFIDNSRWVLWDEYPYARGSVIFQGFCIILYWPNYPPPASGFRNNFQTFIWGVK